MSLRAALKVSARWFLIYWPAEDALSVVKEDNVVSRKEGLTKGQWCKIKEGRKVYDGKIVEIGEKKVLEAIEEKFLINDYVIDFDCDKSGEEDGKANKKEHQLSTKEMKEKNKENFKVGRKRKTNKEEDQQSKKKKTPKRTEKLKGSIIVVSDHSQLRDMDRYKDEEEKDKYKDEEEKDRYKDQEEKDRYKDQEEKDGYKDEEEKDDADNMEMLETDPLLLEVTVCGLEKQIEEQESLLKEAYKRIETIEKKLEAADVDTDTIEDFHTNINMYNDDTDSFYHSFPAHQIPFQPPVANVSSRFRIPFHRTENYYPSVQSPFQSPPSFTESSPSLSPPSTILSSSSPNTKCIPVKAKCTALPSTAINKTNLVPVSQTLGKYPKLQHESKASILAVKLARESFFGEEVLAQCTVMGFGKLPALPTVELNDMKQTLFSIFPTYWSSPVEFEGIWKDCAESIGQVCKRLRIEEGKKGNHWN